jgi:hypothetical protein
MKQEEIINQIASKHLSDRKYNFIANDEEYILDKIIIDSESNIGAKLEIIDKIDLNWKYRTMILIDSSTEIREHFVEKYIDELSENEISILLLDKSNKIVNEISKLRLEKEDIDTIIFERNYNTTSILTNLAKQKRLSNNAIKELKRNPDIAEIINEREY